MMAECSSPPPGFLAIDSVFLARSARIPHPQNRPSEGALVPRSGSRPRKSRVGRLGRTLAPFAVTVTLGAPGRRKTVN
jgi:hypothetical protein